MKSIQEYLDKMEYNNSSRTAIENAETVLIKFEKHAGKQIDKIAEEDITAYLIFLNKKHTQGTLNVKKYYLKNFFMETGHEDLVKDIKIKRTLNDLDPHDILTPDDINSMIKTTENRKYKAIISILYECGCRISELLAVRVKDIEETEHGMVMILPNQKTRNRTGIGYRKVPLITSAGYLRNYLLYVNLNKDETLFDNNRGSINITLKRIAEKAGIKKPISCHKFRHGAATQDVQNGMQESILRQKYGWTPSSTMLERYIHLNDNAVVNAVFGKDNEGKIVQVETADESIIESLQRQNAEMKAKMDNLDALIKEKACEILNERFET